MSSSPRPDRSSSAGTPAPLTVAASLVGVEAVVFLALAVVEAAAARGERLVLGLTTVAFFAAYAAFLAWCALQLLQRRSWARAPVVLAQLIQVLVGASFWGGGTTFVAIMVITAGLLVLAGVFHPDSLAALESE